MIIDHASGLCLPPRYAKITHPLLPAARAAVCSACGSFMTTRVASVLHGAGGTPCNPL
jgi:hypothetical protein